MKTRIGVFETNSSSSHSLVLAQDFSNVVDAPLPKHIVEQGVVTIFSGEFGWEQEEYDDYATKASYLFVDAFSGGGEPYDDPNDEIVRNKNIKLKMLVEAFKIHAGVDVFFEASNDQYHPYGYIDHQSVGI